MRKIFFGVISILVIAGLAWFFFWQKQIPATAPGEQVNETAEKGWIEVINRGAYLVNTDGTLGSELKTGDELTGGQTLMTDQTGLVNLHFSDGSVVRLETQTKVELKDFAYFSESQTLKVKIFLQSGRVWSRIKALITTQSYWEVETTNAVAAVRGTSFGVVYVPGQTTIIGSVHLINVNAIDPQTKKMIENNTAFVGEEQYIKINDQDIVGLKNGVKLTTKIRPYTQAIINDAWVIKSKAQDEKIEGQTVAPVVNTSSTKEEIVISSTEKTTEEIVETLDYSIIQRGSGNTTVVTPEEKTETQIQSDDQTTAVVEEVFYYSTDDPTKGDLTDDSQINDYPVGAAPDTAVDDSNQTSSSSSEDYVDPTYANDLQTLNSTSNEILEKSAITTLTPITNLRPVNLIR